MGKGLAIFTYTFIYCIYKHNRFYFSYYIKHFRLKLNLGRQALQHITQRIPFPKGHMHIPTLGKKIATSKIHHQVQKIVSEPLQNSPSPFSLQGLYNLHTGQALGFADSHHPGNRGGQATPPKTLWGSRA